MWQVPDSVTALSIVHVEGLVFACGAEGVVGSTGKVGGIAISKVRLRWSVACWLVVCVVGDSLCGVWCQNQVQFTSA